MSTLATPENLASPLLPELAGPPGRRIGRLPAEGPGLSCWKIENPDPAAPYDFWFMAALLQAGPSSLLSLAVPTADGGLVHAVHTAEHRIHAESTVLQTLTSRHGRFGPVSVLKLEAESYYRGLRRIVAKAGCRVARYGPAGELVSPYRELGGDELPPFPAPPFGPLERAGEPCGCSDLVLRALGAADLQVSRAVHFDTFTPVGDDLGEDFEVDNGVEVEGPEGLGRSLGAEAEAPRPPGLYLEVAAHGGSPALALALWWLQPEEGAPLFLFGDACTQVTLHQLEQHVFVKRRRSWFRTRTRVRILRKELLVDQSLCRPLPAAKPAGPAALTDPAAGRSKDPAGADPELTALVEEHWAWIQGGRREDQGRQLAERAAGLARRLPPEPAAFAAAVAEGVRRAGEGAIALGPVRLPARNAGPGAPHVALFDEHGGLVHGGVVRIGGSTLTCRAFRHFEMTAPGAGRIRVVDTVAGAVELRDAGGKVVERWSTAERLQPVYESPAQPLPTGAAVLDFRPGSRGHTGFYLALPEREQPLADLAMTVVRQERAELPDTGPLESYYRGRHIEGFLPALPTSFVSPPGPEEAVENPLYPHQPTASPGFVISTPYLAVFSPSPALPIVHVALLGACREAEFTVAKVGKKIKLFNQVSKVVRLERKAGWTIRAMRLE